MQYRSIEIDFDIHKKIEIERTSFAESPNDILRRLLGLKPPAKSAPQKVAAKAYRYKDIELPHGTRLKATYRNQQIAGEVVDGEWFVNGRIYTSPSSAISDNATTKSGTKTNLDGYKYWFVKRPEDSEWVFLDTLRSTDSKRRWSEPVDVEALLASL